MAEKSAGPNVQKIGGDKKTASEKSHVSGKFHVTGTELMIAGGLLLLYFLFSKSSSSSSTPQAVTLTANPGSVDLASVDQAMAAYGNQLASYQASTTKALNSTSQGLAALDAAGNANTAALLASSQSGTQSVLKSIAGEQSVAAKQLTASMAAQQQQQTAQAQYAQQQQQATATAPAYVPDITQASYQAKVGRTTRTNNLNPYVSHTDYPTVTYQSSNGSPVYVNPNVEPGHTYAAPSQSQINELNKIDQTTGYSSGTSTTSGFYDPFSNTVGTVAPGGFSYNQIDGVGGQKAGFTQAEYNSVMAGITKSQYQKLYG